MEQPVDLKRLLLCLKKNLILIIAGTIAGAVLCAGIYLVKNLFFLGEESYSAVSKLYLDFAVDESGEVYQYYNGYTWSDLMTTDPILDKVMEELTDAGVSLDRGFVEASIGAEILSDIRLLTITVTAPDKEKANQISVAVSKALERYGEEQKEFIEINTIKPGEASKVVTGDYLPQAIILGAILGLLVSFIVNLLALVTEDDIYVPEDCKRLYGVRFAGMFYEKTNDLVWVSDKDIKEESTYLCLDSEEFVQRTKTVVQNKSIGEDNSKAEVVQIFTNKGVSIDGIKNKDSIYIVAKQGAKNGKRLRHTLEMCADLDLNVKGIIIGDAKKNFIKSYYHMV